MDKYYTVLRSNGDGTLTVLLHAAGHDLQQDVSVPSGTPAGKLDEIIFPFLDQLEADIKALPITTYVIDPSVQDLIDKATQVQEVTIAPSSPPLPSPVITAMPG